MVAKKRKKGKWKINFNRKKVTNYFFLSFSIVLISFLALSCFNIYQKQRSSEKDMNSLIEEIERLEKERDLLNFTLGETFSDEYLERVAREDLGMQKPGEKIYVIKKDINLEEEKEELLEESLFDKIKKWFSNILPE
ncbi:MAG: septum formation initiator family protein [Candidatus Pacebacteria bacterium]|nr:septum formation initiator family protein [Candidatus Paceibacterota bacterium]